MDLSDSKEAKIFSGENCGKDSRHCTKWMSNLIGVNYPDLFSWGILARLKKKALQLMQCFLLKRR